MKKMFKLLFFHKNKGQIKPLKSKQAVQTYHEHYIP